MSSLPSATTAAGEAAAKLDGAWSFDLSSYMSGEEYNKELIAAAEASGIALRERDGRLYCFPLLMRPLARETAVKIGKRTERGLRPKELLKKLAAMQKRPLRFSEQRFLDLLYKAFCASPAPSGGTPTRAAAASFFSPTCTTC